MNYRNTKRFIIIIIYHIGIGTSIYNEIFKIFELI